ncbi:hypothetical protein AAVH_29045 [Aphelenchoides avenae]|nr:hypothetical protein AAVH_29045 [Aphelenchus avenae]
MERFLNTGPFAEKLNADQKKALLVFAEANKKLKKSEFRPKFQAEFVPTMPVDIQALLSVDAHKKRMEEYKAKEAGLSDAAKAVCEKFRKIRENLDITVEGESNQINALFDSAEYKGVADELKANGFPVPK